MTPTIAILRRLIEEDLGLPCDQLSLESRLDDIGIDSLTFMELSFGLEKELNISFPGATPAIRTVGDFVALVDGLRAKAGR
ncbi:acyl carrier protein [Candidatus Ferrigenium straubiae]|mgnify:CR=1 FL=1|jgi:acyl carrier protein|uniref:acyl carrier protein n=1 Tax=Candidatus Ferrigenium straubiae TaxID=2919506 RepID=UPI003F4ABFDF